MIARAAEANPSCFSSKGLEDPIKVVIPRLLKLVRFVLFLTSLIAHRSLSQAIATSNHYGNTKYILNAMNLHSSPTPPGRDLNREMKQKMNKARTYEEMGAAFDVGVEEVAELKETRVEELLPVWTARRKEIVEKEGEY
jgi:tRNA-dihydrouridine synthase 2